MSTVGTGVADGSDPGAGQALFDKEIPLLHPSVQIVTALKQVGACPVILRRGGIGSRSGYRHADSGIGKGPDGNTGGVGAVRNLVQIDGKRRRAKVKGTMQQTCVSRDVSDAITATHHQRIGNSIRRAESRSDVSISGIPHMAAISICAGKRLDALRAPNVRLSGIERADVVESFGGSGLEI